MKQEVSPCSTDDIAKYKHEAAVIDEAGMALLDSISFANSKEGCEKLLALFQRLDIAKDALIVGMEATGHYWLSVYGYLLERGFEVKVINPSSPRHSGCAAPTVELPHPLGPPPPGGGRRCSG